MMGATAVQGIASTDQSQASRKGEQFGFTLVCLALILLPIERVLLPASLKLVDMVFVLILVYGIVKILITGRRIYFPLVLPFWLILIASLVATMGGVDKTASLTAILQEIYLYLWFLILTNLLAGFSIENFERLLKIWTLIAVMQAVFTLLGMLTVGPMFFYVSPENIVLVSYGGLARGLGTFVNPNATGAFLSISFFITLSTNWPRKLRNMFALILCAGMFASGSMGAMLTTLIGLAALVLLSNYWSQPQRNGNKRKVIVYTNVILILTLLVFFLFYVFYVSTPALVEQKWLALTLGRLPRSFGLRFQLLANAWPVFVSNPFGVGPNAFQILLGTIHNDYAGFLFERGLLGLIGWLLLIGSCLFNPLATARRAENSTVCWMIYCMVSGIIACSVNALMHEISHFRQFWILMAFLFALNYMVNSRSKPLKFNG